MKDFLLLTHRKILVVNIVVGGYYSKGRKSLWRQIQGMVKSFKRPSHLIIHFTVQPSTTIPTIYSHIHLFRAIYNPSSPLQLFTTISSHSSHVQPFVAIPTNVIYFLPFPAISSHSSPLQPFPAISIHV